MAARLELYRHRVPEELYQVDEDPTAWSILIERPDHQEELKKSALILDQVDGPDEDRSWILSANVMILPWWRHTFSVSKGIGSPEIQ